MQVSRTFQGEVTLEDATVDRPRSYGGDTAINIKVYPSKLKALNEPIAQFLQTDCHMSWEDAHYETGPDSEWPFLWIYGVPFLFAVTGTSNSMYFYYPAFAGSGYIGSTGYQSGGEAASVSPFSGSKYAFKLSFCGNPKTCFCLRFSGYSAVTGNSTSLTLPLVFAKAQNIINGADSTLWRIRNYSVGQPTYSYALYYGFFGMDIGTRRKLMQDTIPSSMVQYCPLLWTIKEHKNANEGALPLVPFMVGPYRLNGVYLSPRNYDLPNPNAVTAELQTEITIGNRSFLVTNSNSTGSYINMGLIETT